MTGFDWHSFFAGLAVGASAVAWLVSNKLETGRRDHRAEQLTRRWKRGGR